MISDTTRAHIRRLHFAEGWPVGTIATELGLHHDTVERAIAAETVGLKARPIRQTIVDPYKGFITATLEQHPRLRATRVHEMVKSRGYAGSVVQIRRFVRRVRPRRAEAYLRLKTLPGEQAQVDWGSFGRIKVGRAIRSLSCFVMVLSHSRAMHACFFCDQKLESFLAGHVQAFEAFGGVPRDLLYDNLKSAVVERVGEHIRFHSALLELAGTYHFAPKPCAPYRANEKGKVERAIHYLRHSFFAARPFRDLADLNAQLAEWIANVAHQRPAPTDPERHSVATLLELERPRLLPLPAHPFPCESVRAVAVGKTPYVRFDLNDYSVPHDRVRSTLTVIASSSTVRLVDDLGALVAEHPRSYDRGQTIEDEAHFAALTAAKRRARTLRQRDRLCLACPQADALLHVLAERQLPLHQHVRELLLLIERYGATPVDAAIGEALARQAASAYSVAHILDQDARARSERPPIDVLLPDDLRDVDVAPHDLASYDALSAHEDDHDAVD